MGMPAFFLKSAVVVDELLNKGITRKFPKKFRMSFPFCSELFHMYQACQKGTHFLILEGKGREQQYV